MFHYYKLYSKLLPTHLFITSFLIFIVINTIENVIHYSIGRDTDKKNITIKNPTYIDWIRIIIIMIVFAIIQAILTCLFNHC